MTKFLAGLFKSELRFWPSSMIPDMRLVAGGRHDVVTTDLEYLAGRAPKSVQRALEHNGRVRKAVQGA
jgi:hypothetical protein